MSYNNISLLKKALSEHCVEQVHLSFGHHPLVIQVQKFVPVFVTIRRRAYGTMLSWKVKTAPSHITALRFGV